jgi:phenylacetate-coenzyme A ligase PaaK-like adenylate-forming protein
MTEAQQEIFNRFLKALEQTERAPREQLLRYQQGLLERLLRHAYEQVPFYRNRLACLFTRQGDIDFRRWQEVPIVTRGEAARHTAEMRTTQLPSTYGNVREIHTSGSTGAPLAIASNALVGIAANAALTRMAQWWDIDPSRSLARIALFQDGNAPAYPEGRDKKKWSFANPDAAMHELDLLTPVEQQLEWLLRKKAPYLMTSSSNATALAYAASAEQARELALEIIFAVAETVLPRSREIVAERLDVVMAGIYSCEEVGCIATECPQELSYHVVAENVLVEILDDSGLPVRPGETGEVVLTGLYNYAMPFIRYAVGDVATAGPDLCRCGRSLPVIAQIDGRTRHAFVFKDGSRVWPRLWNLAIDEFVPCREFQLVQLDHERIELRYVPDGSGRPPDDAGLKNHIKQKIHPAAETALAPMQSIPRGPGGKLSPFVSMVAE